MKSFALALLSSSHVGVLHGFNIPCTKCGIHSGRPSQLNTGGENVRLRSSLHASAVGDLKAEASKAVDGALDSDVAFNNIASDLQDIQLPWSPPSSHEQKILNEVEVGEESGYLRSLVTLGIITFMWSIQSSAVRMMYNAVEHHPPLAIMSAGGALAALVTVVCLGQVKLFKDTDAESEAPPILEDVEAQKAGLELGTYKFLALASNYWGLSLTLSSQAAFCIQLTTVIVPIAQAFMGVRVKPQIWAAVAMAIGGVSLLTLDGMATVGEANLHNLLIGDALCVLAACFYSCYDVRVNEWSKRATPVPLTIYKTAYQSLYACVALGAICISGTGEGQKIFDWFAQVTPDELHVILLVMVLSGAFANGIATLLQIGAQRVVGPSRAQLIYSTNPMWVTLIAVNTMGEKLDPVGYTGAFLFLTALAIASVTPPDGEEPAAGH